MGYRMYAWAGNGGMTRNVTITSIANNQKEINEQTSPGAGVITSLESMFKVAKRPAPFSFVWKPENGTPRTLFRSLFNNGEFALELRLAESSSKTTAEFNFYGCKLLKPPQTAGNGHMKIEATYKSFG